MEEHFFSLLPSKVFNWAPCPAHHQISASSWPKRIDSNPHHLHPEVQFLTFTPNPWEFSHFSPTQLNNRSTQSSLRSRNLKRAGEALPKKTKKAKEMREGAELLTPLIILKVVSGVAVGLCCPQGPQPGEVSDHGIGSTIHNAWTGQGQGERQRGKPHRALLKSLLSYCPHFSQGMFSFVQSCSS